ncbi:MAG: pyridoxal phosphate-dependent aminotransferase [Thermoguttaceae bacterium]|nr:pyridoxal phosphate-dependent aminotransferase [Thermoguttaceae bacterium]
MGERNKDFDVFVERHGTGSIKYDNAALFGVPDGLMGFWVADMDFRAPSCAQDALRKIADHGVFGYTNETDAYFDAVARWMSERHHYEVAPESLVKTPGVVFALAQCVRAFTKIGDAVVVQQPVYPPFAAVVRKNRRELVSSDLKQDDQGVYHIDFEDFERKVVEKNVKLFILCSPHNPVGRVWTRDELTRLGEICVRHGVLVVSDEIHHDFVFKGVHTVFETIKPEFAENCVTCTAPSKTFNLAGLQTSNIFIRNKKLRDVFRAEVEACGVDGLNQAGQAAARAVYTNGGEWYEAMLKYVEGNFELAVDFINTEIPRVSTVKSEGTYLLWVDFRATGWDDDKIDRVLREDAGVWLNSGNDFGAAGRGFQRMNLACSRDYLRRGLEKMRDALTKALS